jgi:hypothetical protein
MGASAMISRHPDSAVERTQRVRVGPATALLAEAVRMVADERRDLVAIGGAAVLIAHRVQQYAHALARQT